MLSLAKKIFGTANERTLKKLRPVVARVAALEPEFQALSPDALRAKTDEFKKRLADGEALDEILPEAFAAVREASRRTIGAAPLRRAAASAASSSTRARSPR